METNPTLLELFEERDEMFKEITDKIYEEIPHVVEGARKFLLKQEGEEEVGNLSWEDISIYPDGEDPFGFLMLVGVISYRIGDTYVTTAGEKIEVTLSNVDYFRRLLRIGIPFDLVESNSVEAVTTFLEQTATEDSQQATETAEQIIRTIVDAASGESESEFDLDELTEEQRQKLAMYSEGGNG